MHSQYLLAVLSLALPAFSYNSELGCYSKVNSLTSPTKFMYQDLGWCEQQCGKDKYSLAFLQGLYCSCGNELAPSSAKVDDDKCNEACQGFPHDKCGGKDVYSVIQVSDREYTTADSDSDSDSSSDSDSDAKSTSEKTVIMAPTTTTTPAPSTAAGGVVVAPTNITESDVPTGILTAPGSMVSKASSSSVASAKITTAAGGVAVAHAISSTSSTPSSTPTGNAANALHAGPVAGVLVAGLGLLL